MNSTQFLFHNDVGQTTQTFLEQQDRQKSTCKKFRKIGKHL
jgi:hypothetical protein